MPIIGYFIILILIAAEIYEFIVDKINDRYIEKVADNPPTRALRVYSSEELKKSGEYHKDKSRIGHYESLIHGIIFFALLLFGVFQWFSAEIFYTYNSEYLRALIFFTFYQLLFALIGLPFDIYETFVIEKKYEFNKTTPALFVKDMILGGTISYIIFVIILFVVIKLIQSAGTYWYLYAACAVFLFSLFMMYLYPVVIAPLFNKFQPLENKELESEIFKLADKADFPVKNILQMDASKRSTHSNAYFTGFGKNKRIVLFDTLLNNHTQKEIINILAHEIGHYKLGHLKKMLFFMFISVFVSFFLVGILINNEFIYHALGFEKSIFTGLFIISVILSPIGKVFEPVSSFFSRKHEYEADNFAVKLTGERDTMADTLVHLHKDNLSFPLPHPLYVKIHYSHPPLLKRIEHLSTGA